MADVGDYHPACASVLAGLFEGLAAGCGRHIPVHLKPTAGGKAPFLWSVGLKPPVRLQSRRPPLRPAHVESGPDHGREALRAWPSRRRAREHEMPDIAVAEIPVDEEERPLPPPQAPVRNALLDGPILRTLLWLAWPNVIALSAGTCVVIAETSYIGRLGVESLAAMALVFPCVILTMTMSGGAMGGGVASAIARALGAGDRERASTLAAHALLIGLCFGLTFMLGMLIFGPRLLELLGGRGNVLAQAVALFADLFRRRGSALADEHHGRDFARHRQHEIAVAADSLLRRLPDHSGRHARARPWADPAIRHARRRRGVADRLLDQHFHHGLVSVFRAGARRSQNLRPARFNGRCSSTS